MTSMWRWKPRNEESDIDTISAIGENMVDEELNDIVGDDPLEMTISTSMMMVMTQV